MKSDGRWHTAGRHIVYLSEHPALALIENLVHLKGNPRLFPDKYQLLRVDVPASIVIEELDYALLLDKWEQNVDVTRKIGDAWLRRGRSPLLAIPSVVSPESINFLLNPDHADAENVSVVWSKRISYDQRLFKYLDNKIADERLVFN